MSKKTEVYGNKDLARTTPIQGLWLDSYVVKQQRKINIGGISSLTDHTPPVQVYTKDEYERLTEPGKGDKSRFERQGIVATVLHDPTEVLADEGTGKGRGKKGKDQSGSEEIGPDLTEAEA